MKTIDFYPQYAKLIYEGKKTQTRRTRPYDFQPGDLVQIEDDPSIILEIVSVRGERLRSVSEEDGIKEGFSGRDDFLKCEWAVEQLKSGNPWVWIYNFKVVK